MSAHPQAEGQTDVVFSVSWACSGVEGYYNARICGDCLVTYTQGSPYTPYANLTQEQVLDWVWASGVDKADTEAAIQQQIDNQSTPTVVNPPLPWTQGE